MSRRKRTDLSADRPRTVHRQRFLNLMRVATWNVQTLLRPGSDSFSLENSNGTISSSPVSVSLTGLKMENALWMITASFGMALLSRSGRASVESPWPSTSPCEAP